MIKTETKRSILGLKISYGVLLVINDIIFSGLSCFLAYLLRFYTDLFSPALQSYSLDMDYVIYSLIFIGAIVIFNLILRLYSLRIIYRDPFYYLKIFAPPVLGVLLMILIGRLYESFPFSRLWVLFLILFSAFFLFLSRYFIGLVTKRYLRLCQ